MKEKQIQINELVAYCKQQVNPKKEPSTIVELRYQTPGRTWSEIHDIAREVANQLPSARSVFSAKAEPNGNITIFSRPCKEFVQLSSWQAKYAGYILEVDTVSRLSVSGKRSTYDVTGAEYLCYKPEECIKSFPFCASIDLPETKYVSLPSPIDITETALIHTEKTVKVNGVVL